MPRSRLLLIVDDAVDNRAILRDALESEGYSVLEAGNGRDGLDLLGRSWPGAVLLDLKMPELDGLGFVRAYRERYAPTDRLPIIAMSASMNPARQAELQRLGVLSCPAMPYDLDELLQAVEQVVRDDADPGGSRRTAVLRIATAAGTLTAAHPWTDQSRGTLPTVHLVADVGSPTPAICGTPPGDLGWVPRTGTISDERWCGTCSRHLGDH